MKDKKCYQHCDSEYYTSCANSALEMDTEQLEYFAKELLNVVSERKRIEKDKKIRKHIEAIEQNIDALNNIGYGVEILSEIGGVFITPGTSSTVSAFSHE